MTDIVPGLLKALEDRLQKAFDADRELQTIRKRIEKGTAQSIDSERFSVRAGEVLSRVWKDVVTQGELPDDRMYYNIASRLMDPMLHAGFDEVSAVCKGIIQTQYAAAGKPLSQVVAVDADFSQDRLDGLIDYISSKESYSEAEAEFLEKLVNFHQDIHSQTVERNFRNLGQMGFTPQLVRKSLGGCCEWCLGLVGSYDYDPGMDREVFRRHSHCRCTVEYFPDGPRGGYQDVHTKEWHTPNEGNSVENLGQHKKGDKVMITGQAITKVHDLQIPGYSQEQAAACGSIRRELLTYAQQENDSNEVACVIDLRTGQATPFIEGYQDSINILAQPDIYHWLNTCPDRTLEITHNHPGTSYFSLNDLNIFMRYPSVKTMTVVTNKGKTWYISKTPNLSIKEAAKTMSILRSRDLDNDELIEAFLKMGYSLGIERN